MFLGSLLRSVLVATLFASSAFAVCCSYNRVRHVGYMDEDNATLLFEELNYAFETMATSVPVSSAGYMMNVAGLVGRSIYQHPASYINVGNGLILTGPIITVYVFAADNEWYSVEEANLVELANGANEREIKSGFTSSPYLLGEVNYTNGDKEVYYRIPDLSNSTKRVKVVTCPNSVYTPANNAGIVCTTTFAFIKGTANE
jgi:hypothetical protein